MINRQGFTTKKRCIWI